MKRGARSFPPPPFSVFERERRSDGSGAAPGRVSGAGLPSPPPAARHRRAPPRPPRAPGPEPGALAGGLGGPGAPGAGDGRGSRRPRLEVHVGVAVVCQNRARSSGDRSLPGSSALLPAPLRRARA